MSHRFPPIAPQDPSPPKVQTRAIALPQAPSLPWFELAIGVALLILLRGF